MDKRIKVDKLECARRQLETAIELYFQEKDEVSIHTLTAASYSIISAINKNIDGSPMLIKGQIINKKTDQRKGGIFDSIWPKYHNEIFNLLQSPENFFKHAGRDYKKEIEFSGEQTEPLIFDAILKYRDITKSFPSLFKAFYIWFSFHHIEIFELSDKDKDKINEKINFIQKTSKKYFIEEIFPELTDYDIKLSL